MPLHPDLDAPCEYGIAGELGVPLSLTDHARLAALGDQLGQLAQDTVPGYQGVRHSRQARSCHVNIPSSLSSRLGSEVPLQGAVLRGPTVCARDHQSGLR